MVTETQADERTLHRPPSPIAPRSYSLFAAGVVLGALLSSSGFLLTQRQRGPSLLAIDGVPAAPKTFPRWHPVAASPAAAGGTAPARVALATQHSVQRASKVRALMSSPSPSSTPHPSAASSPPAPVPPPHLAPPSSAPAARNPWLTTQSCLELATGFEEVCVYEGPVCWDTSSWRLRVGVPTGESYAQESQRYESYDPRWGVPRVDPNIGGLPGLPAAAYASPAAWAGMTGGDAAAGIPARPSETLATRVGRLWGPDCEALQMHEISWEALAGATSAKDAALLGPSWAAAAATARRPAELAAAQSAARFIRYHKTTRVPSWEKKPPPPPNTVTWLHPAAPGDAAYITKISSWAMDHVYHFPSATFGFWAAKRANASVVETPVGGDETTRRPPPLRMAAGIAPLPPMGSAVLLGDYLGPNGAGVMARVEDLPAFTRGLLPLLTQPATRIVFNENMRRDMGVPAEDPRHLLCVPRAVTTSSMFSMFASEGDAAAFRALAWAAANVTSGPPRPVHPPRRIAILNRQRRGLARLAQVEALVADTGLDWGHLTSTEPGMASWAKQVRSFAAVG